MKFATPELEGTSVVLIGAFNSQIFHPTWFAREQLIRQSEADAAKIEVVSPEYTAFSSDWLTVEVQSNRASFSTASAGALEPLRDLVVGSFKLLRHTPVNSFGLNFFFHYKAASESTWHEVGHKLAPKEVWAGVLEQPGMKSLTIQGVRPDGFKGRITVKVEPSVKVHPGVFFQINDHYALEESSNAGDVIEQLAGVWDVAVARATNIVNTVLERL